MTFALNSRMLYLSLRLPPRSGTLPRPGRKPRQTHSPYARCTLQRVESGCQTARIRRIDAPSDTPAPVRGGLPSHEERPGLISQTLEGCRRGRSGVRPLRQPVATRLLKISQKMNPNTSNESQLDSAAAGLSRDLRSFRGVILRPNRSTRPRPQAVGQHFPPAPHGNRAARRSDGASIRLSTFAPTQQSGASGPH